MKVIFPCSYYLPENAANLYITDNESRVWKWVKMDVNLCMDNLTKAVGTQKYVDVIKSVAPNK